MAGLFKNKDGSKKKFVEKFEQSGFGKFVKEKLPALADKVADFLPDKGGLGIIKHILDQDPKVKQEFKALSTEDQMKFWSLKAEFVLQMAKVEAEDRANARAREMAYVNAGRRDFMMLSVGYTVLGTFVMLGLAILFKPGLEDNPQIIRLETIIESAMMLILGYYYGTSNGSREKTMMMNQNSQPKEPE